MKFISWNVNGIRACAGKGFMDFFQETDADIFCIQETKMQEGQLELRVDHAVVAHQRPVDVERDQPPPREPGPGPDRTQGRHPATGSSSPAASQAGFPAGFGRWPIKQSPAMRGWG